MSEKTRKTMKLQVMLCMLLGALAIGALFVPLATFKFSVKNDMVGRFEDYIDSACLIKIFTSENEEELQEFSDNVDECMKLLNSQDSDGYINMEIDMSFVEFLYRLVGVIRMEQNLTRMARCGSDDPYETKNALEELESQSFSEIDIENLQIVYLIESFNSSAAEDSTAESVFTKLFSFGGAGDNDLSMSLSLIILAILVPFLLIGFDVIGIIIIVSSIVKYRSSKDECEAYYRATSVWRGFSSIFVANSVRCILFLMLSMFEFRSTGEDGAIITSHMDSGVSLKFFGVVFFGISIIGSLIIGATAYLKNNTEGQTRLLNSLLLKKLLSFVFASVCFAVALSLSEDLELKGSYKLLINLPIMMVLVLVFGGLVTEPCNRITVNPHCNEYGRKIKKAKNLQTRQANGYAFIYAMLSFVFLLPAAMALILPKLLDGAPIRTGAIIKAAVVFVCFIVLFIIEKISASRIKRIGISEDEKTKLFYGIPDDDHSPA